MVDEHSHVRGIVTRKDLLGFRWEGLTLDQRPMGHSQGSKNHVRLFDSLSAHFTGLAPEFFADSCVAV